MKPQPVWSILVLAPAVAFAIVAPLPAGAAESYARLDEETAKMPQPLPGLDKAAVRAPEWCAGHAKGEKFYPDALGRHLSQIDQYPLDVLPEAALKLCDADFAAPSVQKAAAYIEQCWINLWGVSSADAVETLRYRFDTRAWEAGKKSLCDALKVSEEISGPEKKFNAAKRDLFDCGGDSVLSVGTAPMLDLVAWLDASGTPADEMVRFAYLALQAKGTLGDESYRDKSILFTVMDQIYAGQFSSDKLLAMLAAQPYAQNPYAIGTVKEQLGLYRLRRAMIDAEVAKRAKDDDWKEILVAAPRRGTAAYAAAAEKWKAELKRSNDFEQLAFGPSMKALSGCTDPLRKDLRKVLKSLKGSRPDELRAAIDDSQVAGLLLQRYVVCLAADGNPEVASGLRRHLPKLRITRGPRVAAYYAALDAITRIREDRAKFPVEAGDLPFDRTEVLEDLATDILSRKQYDTIGFTDVQSGVVKKAKSGDKGAAITFNPQKRKVYTESCVDTGRIVMFDHDLRPIYYRKSKPTGLQTVDVSPAPIVIPAALADGIKKGKAVEFAVVPYNTGDRMAMPLYVYKDKKMQKLVGFFGIGF